MNQIYCGECETFMVKEKIGFPITVSESGSGMLVRGDLYLCPKCKKIVYGDFGEPFANPRDPNNENEKLNRKIRAELKAEIQREMPYWDGY